MSTYDDDLAGLLTPALDPLLWRPTRVNVASAWYGHIPFAHWVMRATAPRCFVELGTHNGVSYSAFCEAVIRAGLPTACYAVDTWQGDPHAGLYGEEVFRDLRAFHDERYAGFSKLIRGTFDEAVTTFADGSIDLLHIDGLHTYEAVRHDFDTWLPKLSERAVVLLHDSNERGRDFGVWRLFAELSEKYPTFEFLHSSGLGVIAVGRDVPPALRALCELDDDASLSAMRQRFAEFGGHWFAETKHHFALSRSKEALAGRRAEIGQLKKQVEASTSQVNEAQQSLVQLQSELNLSLVQLQSELNLIGKERDYFRLVADRLWRSLARLRGRKVRYFAKMAVAAKEFGCRLLFPKKGRRMLKSRQQRAIVDLIQDSPYFDAGWYLATYPDVAAAKARPALHYLKHGASENRDPGPVFSTRRYKERHARALLAGTNPLTHLLEHGHGPADASPRVLSGPSLAALGARRAQSRQSASDQARRSIVYVSPRPAAPGHAYRVQRYVAAASALGLRASWLSAKEASEQPGRLAEADIVVLWRVTWDQTLAGTIVALRELGIAVVYDVDDLMFDPAFAQAEIIDAIRSQNMQEDSVRVGYSNANRMLLLADFCTCATHHLAYRIRRFRRPAYVLPNTFGSDTYARASLARRRRLAGPADKLVRLGYAGGTFTHQRDFAVAAAGIARVLRERPQTRLTLFFSAQDGKHLIDVGEYPELAQLQQQIEWRDKVELAQLPDELARFDVNLAPLEVGNSFCESKSELKYFEAAIVGVCTVASPTDPFARAIAHGVNGYIASTSDDWYRHVLQLVDQPTLRAELAQTAHDDALARFGPNRAVDAMASLIDQLEGGYRAARSFERGLRRDDTAVVRCPPKSDAEIVFHADALAESAVTVIVPCYNYAQFLTEALDSVAAQSMPNLDLIIVDDASTDESLEVARTWVTSNASRVNRVRLLRNRHNSGVGASRNLGISQALTEFVLPLDADNRLLPDCCERLSTRLRESRAGFAYPILQQFGEAQNRMGDQPFYATRFAGGNFVDTLTMVSKAAWLDVGGYNTERLGWQDYEFWCRMVERGYWGARVAEPLAEYRVHAESMRKNTDALENKLKLIAFLEARHPWLTVYHPERGAFDAIRAVAH